jgi:hypothetical protein
MKFVKALASGLVGAMALTLINETARKAVPKAPHTERLGMRYMAKKFRAVEKQPPDKRSLYWLAFGDELLSNTLYFSTVAAGSPKTAWVRGALLGLGGGIGAVVLPPKLGLDKEPTARTRETQAMTVGWYLLGGLAAAAAYNLFDRSEY